MPFTERVRIHPGAARALLFASILTGLLVVAASPSGAQDICVRTDFGNALTWDFYITGASGALRTVAGIRRVSEVPADGSVFINSDDNIASVRWTAHMGALGSDEEIRHFRCNIDLDTLTGPGERVDVRGGQDPDSELGTCDSVAC